MRALQNVKQNRAKSLGKTLFSSQNGGVVVVTKNRRTMKEGFLLEVDPAAKTSSWGELLTF